MHLGYMEGELVTSERYFLGHFLVVVSLLTAFLDKILIREGLILIVSYHSTLLSNVVI
jgi:hypothetical protein